MGGTARHAHDRGAGGPGRARPQAAPLAPAHAGAGPGVGPHPGHGAGPRARGPRAGWRSGANPCALGVARAGRSRPAGLRPVRRVPRGIRRVLAPHPAPCPANRSPGAGGIAGALGVGAPPSRARCSMAIIKASKIWMNGKWVAWDDARIHILSHVAHYASSVFEGIRCYHTRRGPAIFRLEPHIDRLMLSAKVYRMELPFSRQQIRDACVEVVAANDLKACYLRPLIYRG